MTRHSRYLCLVAAVVAAPVSAAAGMFVASSADRIDPARGEQARIVVAFDQKLHRAAITVKSDPPGLERSWNLSAPVPGQEYAYSWTQPEGGYDYTISVEMVDPQGEHTTEEAFVHVDAASPLTAGIPADSVDLAGRSFDLVSNHPPSRVEIEVLGDDGSVLGTSTFAVEGASKGKPVRVTWTQDREGNVFRISATAHDDFGYWAGAEIIPWSLSIPHEDVIFETGKDEIRPEEAPKVDAAWAQIQEAMSRVSPWVQCSLYVGGYTDTVDDGAYNQSLSERRALSLARYFRGKGAKIPIYYQGFGESVLAVQTADAVDEPRNRRALYIVTAGTPPRSSETPRSAWKKAP